jgi:uncharacterized membrane protein (DUF106 family)
MAFENYVLLVAVAGIVYSVISRVLQDKLGDKKAMEDVQKESARLNKELGEARKAGDKARGDKLVQEQLELLPKMNNAMFSQMKPMFAILVIFFMFNWASAQINPTDKDDIRISVKDDGTGCDAIAGDGIFTACYKLENQNYGKWTIDAKAFRGEMEIARNETYFLFNPGANEDTYAEQGSGAADMVLTSDKKEYYLGDTVVISAVPANMTKGSSFIIQLSAPEETRIDRVDFVLSNGTFFAAELPIEIPLLNIKKIYQPNWWFIFVAFLSGMVISLVYKTAKDRGMIK